MTNHATTTKIVSRDGEKELQSERERERLDVRSRGQVPAVVGIPAESSDRRHHRHFQDQGQEARRQQVRGEPAGAHPPLENPSPAAISEEFLLYEEPNVRGWVRESRLPEVVDQQGPAYQILGFEESCSGREQPPDLLNGGNGDSLFVLSFQLGSM